VLSELTQYRLQKMLITETHVIGRQSLKKSFRSRVTPGGELDVRDGIDAHDPDVIRGELRLRCRKRRPLDTKCRGEEAELRIRSAFVNGWRGVSAGWKHGAQLVCHADQHR
jgi:hypothetical protein